MSFILPLLYFIFANGVLVYSFKKSFGKCLPITLFLSAFIYFFSQVIFKTFNVGLILNLTLPIIFILLIVINIKNKNKLNELKNNFFSNGFYAFVTIYILVFIFDYNRHFTMWDEFSHWGVMVKEMIRNDKFYSVNISTLMAHKDYPPIIQLFELFYTTLSGGYGENYLIRALHLLEFSLLVPFIESINIDKSKKNVIIKTILVTLITYLTLLLFDGHNAINSIYVDYAMAMIVAYLLGIVIFEKDIFSNFNLFSLCISMSFLLLTKQIALTLYLMVIVLLFANYILKNKSNLKLKKEDILKYIKILIMLIVIPFIIYKGWNMYVEKLNITRQFNISDLKITELKNIIQGTSGEKWQYDAAHNYYNAIKTRNMTTSSNIQISYIQSILLTIVLLYFVYLYGKKVFYKGQISLLSIILIIGYIGYAFVMLVMYTFSFGPYEGPNLASFDRYMPTYILICLILIIMLFTYLYSYKNENKKIISLIFVVLFLLQSPKQIDKCFPKIINSYIKDYEIHANIIKENVSGDSKIFILAQNSAGEYQYYVKYYLDNMTTNLEYFSFDTDVLDYNKYYEEELRDYINEFDYFYVARLNDEVQEKYGFIFNTKLKVGQLYKIENNKLILVN